VPDTVVAQVTATFVTFADAFPVPLATVQFWPAGCVDTVTKYAAPLATAVGNVKGPLTGTIKLAPPLFCSATLAPVARPLTVPPIVNVFGGVAAQATAMFVTFAVAVPLPPVTVQV
jgi:hypothetical protein